ncbi:DUF3558 domain-containing protein [Actinophytocola sp.]|uniref:DUF3558 domain-containing protein n=1 Tax=Actinophytocola sp. TaxID=1872138 RepID=UPI003D6BC42C
MRTLRISLASLLLVAGCSTTQAGEPTAVDTPPATTGQTEEPTGTTESPTPERPKRPRDIDLASVDICEVMTGIPVRKYGLDGRPPLRGTSQVFPGSEQCFANGIDKNLSMTLIAVTDQDADEFVETANAEVTDFDAQGYPLAVLKPAQPANCFGVLDVHDGQFVWVSYGLGNPNDQPVTPQNQICETVPKIAASVVSALG